VNRSLVLDERVYAYLMRVGLREPPILARLRQETAALPDATMQISPEQGQLMALLAELIGAERYLEIGTYTGYSSLAVALAMPPGGRLVCCDKNQAWTAIARRYWHQAGVAERIELRLGAAGDSLDALIATGHAGDFDFAFIDADKSAYDGYYERCLTLVRRGGLIAIDNVLWSGAVADPDRQDADTAALRALNQKIHGDDRVSLSLLPIGDGLTLARKR
jgi:caffeoyl-CoA O-methyltransferase